MNITRKHLSRRTFLKGVGAVAVGLPLLDAMEPALGWPQGATPSPTLRACWVYVPNGMMMPQWTPATTGRNFEFTPILKPLERFRDSTLVLSRLEAYQANALGDGPGDHARASATYLTGAHARESGSDIYAGISADQVAAQAIGNQTRLPSLELGLEDNRMVGLCDAKYSCAYTSSISWRTPSSPVPPLTNPRHVFERMFGTADFSVDAATAARRARYRQSILDGAIEETQRLTGTVGPADRRKVDEYLTCIREIEQRILRIQQEGPGPRPAMARPASTPADYAEHTALMYDLQALAFQADLTRITTMMVGRESSIRSYDQIGIPESHHQLSHHRNDAATIDKLVRIQVYHVELFSRFIDKLQTIRDGDAPLLDRCMIVYGAGMSESNRHLHDRLPIVVMGKGIGAQRTGRHIEYDRNVPVTNLHLAVLERMSVRPGRLGDSTGLLEI